MRDKKVGEQSGPEMERQKAEDARIAKDKAEAAAAEERHEEEVGIILFLCERYTKVGESNELVKG